MKVAIISSPYVPVPPPKYGGTERVIHYLIRGLKQEGHEPILLGTGDSTEKCEIIPITNKSLFFPKDPKKLPEFNKQLKEIDRNIKKILKSIKPNIDIIHSHGFDLIDFEDFPNVTTLHGPFILKSNGYKNNFSLEYYEKRSHLNYVTISNNQREAYPSLNYCGTVYNGEDPKEFPIIKRPGNYLVFVGRFDREKNPHMAIQLAINIGIPIKLAGKVDFAGSSYFKEEIKPLLKHPLVEYLGELDQKQTIKLLAHSKVNLHPVGFREPFGLSVLEAAYCGTPTLAVARGSMPELIKVGHTGMLVEDFVEGFHYIEECMKMNREYIAKRARRKFNYLNMAKEYLKVYSKIIKNKK
jgi:glycosyltransferase involved in cell wall biosynthesis